MSGSKGGTQPAGNTTVTTNTQPWSGQIPYLLQGFQGAQNLYGQGGPSYYPGQSYAGPTSLQLTGIQNLADLGLNGTPTQTAALGTAGNILNQNWLSANPGNTTYGNAANGGMNVNTGGYFQPLASGSQTNTAGADTINQFANGSLLSAGNPYFQQMAATTAANVLPGIEGQFNGANRMDSGLASRAVGQGLGDAIGNLAYNNYQQGLGQMLGAGTTQANIGQNNILNQLQAANALTNLGFGNVGTEMGGAQGLSNNYNTAAGNQISTLGLAPNLNNMNYQQAEALQNAGATVQGLNQQAINDAMARWNFGQQQPYQNLANYMQNIGGSFGSQSAQSTPYFTNPLANTLSTALGGVSLLNGLFGGQGGGLFGSLSNLFGGSGGLTDFAASNMLG